MNRAIRALALGAAMGLGALDCGAQDRWDALGPHRVGAAREQVIASGSWHCDAATPAGRCVAAGGRFAGVPVTSIEASFQSERLARVIVRFESQSYPALLAALGARLGEPEDRSYRARAGMAGEFEAGVKLWTQDRVSTVLEEYAGKIDRGALTFGDAAAMEGLITQKRSYPAGASRDL